MDRDVNAPLFADGDAWRVAALSMMPEQKLRSVFAGDAVTAAPWVIAAANAGIVEAQMRLGRMYLSGEGIAKDEAAAFAWLTLAAKNGDAEANNMLGRCHENGWGTPRDFESAGRHYAIAACAGDAWAQYNLGHLFLDGQGVPRDPDKAFAWYKRASDQGHVRAMNLLARCYEEGWGAPRDLPLAGAWYRKSAEGGYFRGAYNYATMLAAQGCIAGSVHWFEKALAAAPEPTRTLMAEVLRKSPRAALRALALGMNETTGATEGLI
jgi:TPR repeat protein